MRAARLGAESTIDELATVGYGYDHFEEPTIIGDQATIRAGTIIYATVTAGDRLSTGHGALIREHTTIGNDVLVGTDVTIDGRTDIGSKVSLQTGAYVPAETYIGDQVFIGPGAVLTNDPFPVRSDGGTDLDGPNLEDNVSIGANATILPGITIGTGSFVAAGSVVTDDIPPRSLALGVPADTLDLPQKLQRENAIA